MTGVSIVASGAVTAIGLDARSSWSAVRAGVSGVTRGNLWDAAGGTWMQLARPRLHQWWEGADMLSALAEPAIEECFAALPGQVKRSEVPVIMLLGPEQRPGQTADARRIVLVGLAQRLSGGPSTSLQALAGRCSLLQALRAAAQWFKSGKAHYVVVCGVDSFLRQHVVDEFAGRRRLLTARNSNGFIPGEAACAVLLAPDGERSGALRIVGAGGNRESAPIDGQAPCTGHGLTEAMRQALNEGGLAMADTQCWLNDQNAEHYKAKECTIAQIRLERRERPAPQAYQVWHPIEYLGEIGSAIGPCLLGLAHAAARGGWLPGPRALISIGEDDGERAAFVLTTSTGAG